METLIFHREIELNRIYFLRFCTNHYTRLSNYRIKLIMAMSSTNATKRRGLFFIFYILLYRSKETEFHVRPIKPYLALSDKNLILRKV